MGLKTFLSLSTCSHKSSEKAKRSTVVALVWMGIQISSAIEFKIDNARPISNDKTTHVSLPQRRREGKPLLIISLRFLSCSIVLEKSCHNQRPEITLTSQVKMTGTTTMEIDQEENLSPSELAAQIAMRQSR